MSLKEKEIIESSIESSIESNVAFEGLELFTSIINSTKIELIELVKEGKVSETTANRIFSEYEYNFFQKMVKVTVK
ncbi:hypothetical protein [Chengkuizengella axinellae]|uniref:Uncharacterized protein n=1 Tax=Chengkuizengella axinellae TaxID=3064388 RepID=A0ABT9IWF3_9BACL|nr:hypothetical protein [Chengkuizengella sp. 2205SS18-9]MDP5273701.1 hypothetical protein [Chengkuizengella sp. 2205SS18-9]